MVWFYFYNIAVTNFNFMMRKLLSVFFLIPVIFGMSCNDAPDEELQQPEGKYVVILSMDGFRHDYPERFNTPNLDYIAENGVSSHSLLPVFPSFTFPNHYSIATGLYPDNHGIVMNNFYCKELDLSYYISDRDAVMNGDFYDGEPIWVSAEKQGVISATYFWVGSEAAIQGIQPTFWKIYDYSVPYETRIDSAISWLSLPKDQRPGLVMLYFNEPDSHGHRVGPESDEIGTTIEYLDELVGILMDELAKLPIADKINLIVTSDHGMGDISPERHVRITDHIKWDWIERFHGGNPVYALQTVDGYKDTVYSILSNVENISVWKNEEIPERLNFGKHHRTLEMLIAADSSWSVGFSKPNEYYKGAHGYDFANRDMHTIFYAIGPDFKAGHQHPEFKVIDIHPLLAYLLNLKTPEVDGKIERVSDMLIQK